MKETDRSLDSKIELAMKIKDRESKKDIIGDIHNCRTRFTAVFEALRKISDLKNIAGNLEVIAMLNDVAYKAV
jgi:hypothetical protein